MTRDRPLHGLSVRRITRVIEAHWDEPRVLAGILHELRFRLEPEAAFQARSIARRLSTLRYQLSQDAARIAEESQAAAMALGASAAAREEPELQATPAPHRRRAAVVALVVAAVLAAGWLLRPRADAREETPMAKSGPAVTARGGTALPSGEGDSSRRPGVAARDEGPTLETNERAPPQSAVVWPSDPQGAGALAGATASASGGAAAGAAPDASHDAVRPEVLRVTPVADAAGAGPERAGPDTESGPAGDLRPEGGVHVTDAAVECFLTDANPDACAAVAGSTTTAGPPTNARGALERPREGADTVHAPAPARVPSPRAPQLLPPDATRAGSPPSAPLPAVPGVPAPSQCMAATSGTIVFVLDGSLSMGLPLGVEPEVEDRLDQAILRHDAAARRTYRALLAESGPKRITRACDAFGAAVQDLPDPVNVGLVVFQECKDIRNLGTFEAPRRDKALDYIRSLIPHGRTPIAASLRTAARMLGKGPSSIVLLTDGRESCSGDPCAAAAEIHAAHPDTPIHVVDMTGQAKAECVAEITGGNVYAPAAGDDLADVLRDAFRSGDASCPSGQD